MLASFQHLLTRRLKAYVDTPFRQLPDEARDHILYGRQVQRPYPRRSLSLFTRLRFLLSRGQDVGGAMVMLACPHCQGYRVGEEARRVTLGQRHIGHLGHNDHRRVARLFDHPGSPPVRVCLRPQPDP